MGGGFARGEHVLVIAPTGAGKTVMACQVASHMCSNKLSGILVSTEQSHYELEPRFVSASCHVPFNRVKDGFTPEKHLTATEYKAYRSLREEVIGDRLAIENWGDDSSRSLITHFDLMVREFLETHDSLDFIILDWLGGALGAMATSSEQKRTMLQNAADYMATVAKKYNIITLSFAQAHPVQGANNRKVDQSVILDCKTLGLNASWVFGISAMENKPEDADNNTQATYSDNQFLWCSKGRKSMAVGVALTRNFAFQRFEP
jgi:replicative DNA helicase